MKISALIGIVRTSKLKLRLSQGEFVFSAVNKHVLEEKKILKSKDDLSIKIHMFFIFQNSMPQLIKVFIYLLKVARIN